MYSREQFIQWAEALGDHQTPSWLGLPNSAETVLLTSLGMLFPVISGCSGKLGMKGKAWPMFS